MFRLILIPRADRGNDDVGRDQSWFAISSLWIARPARRTAPELDPGQPAAGLPRHSVVKFPCRILGVSFSVRHRLTGSTHQPYEEVL